MKTRNLWNYPTILSSLIKILQLIAQTKEFLLAQTLFLKDGWSLQQLDEREVSKISVDKG